MKEKLKNLQVVSSSNGEIRFTPVDVATSYYARISQGDIDLMKSQKLTCIKEDNGLRVLELSKLDYTGKDVHNNNRVIMHIWAVTTDPGYWDSEASTVDVTEFVKSAPDKPAADKVPPGTFSDGDGGRGGNRGGRGRNAIQQTIEGLRAWEGLLKGILVCLILGVIAYWIMNRDGKKVVPSPAPSTNTQTQAQSPNTNGVSGAVAPAAVAPAVIAAAETQTRTVDGDFEITTTMVPVIHTNSVINYRDGVAVGCSIISYETNWFAKSVTNRLSKAVPPAVAKPAAKKVEKVPCPPKKSDCGVTINVGDNNSGQIVGYIGTQINNYYAAPTNCVERPASRPCAESKPAVKPPELQSNVYSCDEWGPSGSCKTVIIPPGGTIVVKQPCHWSFQANLYKNGKNVVVRGFPRDGGPDVPIGQCSDCTFENFKEVMFHSNDSAPVRMDLKSYKY